MECRKTQCTGDHCAKYHSWANEKKATCPRYKEDKKDAEYNDGVVNMLTLTGEDDKNSRTSMKHPNENQTQVEGQNMQGTDNSK